MMNKILPISLAAILAVTLAWPSSASAQQQRELGRDLALSIPQVMTVDAVDPETGELILNGQRYRVALDRDGERELAVMSNDVGSDELSLDDLRPGMRVQVQTDGTLASGGHRPLVLSLTRAEQ